MKLRHLKPSLAAAVATCMLFAGGLSADAAEPVQWEYRVLRIDDSRPEVKGSRPTARGGGAEEALNKLGAEGWELVAVRIDSTSSRTSPIFYFKRPKGLAPKGEASGAEE